MLPEVYLRNTVGDLECSRASIRVEGDKTFSEVTLGRNIELKNARMRRMDGKKELSTKIKTLAKIRRTNCQPRRNF